MWCSLSLTHPPVDDSLSVQEKQTDSNLCSIKPAKLKIIKKKHKCDSNEYKKAIYKNPLLFTHYSVKIVGLRYYCNTI